MKNHLDDHPLKDAFLANRLDRLADLIVAQGDALLEDIGAEFPARAVSTILIIGESGTASAAEVADKLKQPHQVSTQRIELLIRDGLVARTPDAADRRRKLLTLTKKGEIQFKALEKRLETAGQAFRELCDEVACDLPSVLEAITAALTHKALIERVHAIEAKDAGTPKKERNR